MGLFRLGPREYAEGQRLYRRLVEELVACEMMGHWPGARPGVTLLELPKWARQDEDDSGEEW